MQVTLHVWRQKKADEMGRFVTYEVDGLNSDMSFLEVLDILNDRLAVTGQDPVAFDHDCREGICGSCSLVINGRPHGPEIETTTCQLHMRKFRNGSQIWVEPFRAKAFPVVKDLAVDRSAFDNVIKAGGYISVNTGGAPDANALPIPKAEADKAFAAAECIGCGACVAACPNASAMLFVSAKIAHLGRTPQGQPERSQRALDMVHEMDAQGFGNCTNHYECEAACPKGIKVLNIARMNRDFTKASFLHDDINK